MTVDVEEMAIAHWEYIEGILLKCMEMERKMYIDAFIHGYKHGRQDERG